MARRCPAAQAAEGEHVRKLVLKGHALLVSLTPGGTPDGGGSGGGGGGGGDGGGGTDVGTGASGEDDDGAVSEDDGGRQSLARWKKGKRESDEA